MIRPNSLLHKLRIDYTQTWTRLAWLFRNPDSIKPDDVPTHLQHVAGPQYKFKLPQLKGNVYQTLKEIVAIFMADWRRSLRPINMAIRTTRTSLAKRCSNRDPKTAYRHILALIEAGFLRGKVQVKGGLQLLLNPALVVFDAASAPVATAAPQRPIVAPAAPQALAVPAEGGLASLLALASSLTRAGARPS